MRLKFLILPIVLFTINLVALVFLSGFLTNKLNLPRPINLPVYDEQVELSHMPLSTFHTESPKKGLLIYISNTQDDAVIEQARKFAKLSYYVALIDATSANLSLEADTTECKNFALYFENITQELKAHWQIDTQLTSLMIGENQGAAISYVTLAQSKAQDYHAALSLNFEPTIADSKKALCGIADATLADNIQTLPPIEKLPASWYLFQEQKVQEQEINDKFDALKYTDKIPNARLTLVSGTNNRGEKNTALSTGTQILQWLDPRLTDQLHTSGGNGDLPLIEITVPNNIPQNTHAAMAMIVTGDGGWAEIDKNLALHLSNNGIPTVALDSLSYFWKYRSPEETTHAIESTLRNYMAKWHKEKVLLIGYSFGADLMPVVANKFTAQTQHHIALIALLGLGKSAAFEFKLSSWLNADDNPNRIPLHPELQKLTWIQPICVYGLKDKLTQCPNYEADGVKLVALPGNHHFDKKYDDVVGKLLENVRQ